MRALTLARLLAVGSLAAWTACSGPASSPAGHTAGADTPAASNPASPTPAMKTTDTKNESREVATFGGGCFWCTEAVLERLDGVLDVQSGYAGGTVAEPTYEQVCTGRTGHAEVVQVTFDPSKISYGKLLDWFFDAHDPTTLNQQGPDVGTQYRSVILYHSDAQKAEAEAAIARAQKHVASPIVTEVVAATEFWPAEEHHQDYYRRNSSAGYCRVMIAPKLKKLGLDK